VKVTGRACSRIQEGLGWVAAPGRVVTNAHVVAGEDRTTVEDASGRQHVATPVAFDPVRDLAVLAVPDLDAVPLAVADADTGDVGAVYGHPGGGALRVAPARIGDEIVAVGTDIYRTGESRRRVYVLAASLAPGDSGAALVDTAGRVIGTAFAVDPGREATGYALTDDELRAAIEAPAGARADTGRCL
jgi:S1-C subfamily serine protease